MPAPPPPNPLSDFHVQASPDVLLSQTPPAAKPQEFSPPQPVKDMAYGGVNQDGAGTAQAGQIYRLERGYPAFRRGRLLAAVPRTKAETIYAKDANQSLVNPIINKGVAGVATSGVATPGTSNAPNATTGAIVRYRTPYKTLIQ